MNDGANLMRELAGEIQRLAAEIERARATAASLSKLPAPEDEVEARREFRRALAGARRGRAVSGTLASDFRARREAERAWWYESDDPPPPGPPGPSASVSYQRRRQH
jgi:hypothetical protein